MTDAEKSTAGTGQITGRKIVHVDMDAFYASVEQRDDPALKGRPVIVAWRGPRSVVCAASYEARKFGVHSAMATIRAERLCPQAVFLAPDFVRYRGVSLEVRRIFSGHTDLIEPLSLDEAYLDVTVNKTDLPTATRVAVRIREQIREELNLTASAGVAPNKFLSKIASDWKKPNGLFVIQPHEVIDFLRPLPVERIPGVGRVTAASLHHAGVRSVGDLQQMELADLLSGFGRFGQRLFHLARGIDTEPVVPNRPRKSLSVEDTFPVDLPLTETAPTVRRLAAQLWNVSNSNAEGARTIVLKLKTSDFKILTRSLTPAVMPATAGELGDAAVSLFERVSLERERLFRLVGVGLSNFLSGTDETLFS